MTTALPTRPKYAREHLTFSDAEIADFIADGAKVFGEIVVAKVDGRTIAIRPSQVIRITDEHWAEARDAVSTSEDHPVVTEADVATTARRYAQDDYEAQADALGISVGELTDGEYSDSRITVASRAARLDALAAKWS